jgi:hypothetical protein
LEADGGQPPVLGVEVADVARENSLGLVREVESIRHLVLTLRYVSEADVPLLLCEGVGVERPLQRQSLDLQILRIQTPAPARCRAGEEADGVTGASAIKFVWHRRHRAWRRGYNSVTDIMSFICIRGNSSTRHDSQAHV